MPAAVNRLTAAGKAARRRKATIYRDFPAAADWFARRGKPKTAAVDKHFVVVNHLSDLPLSLPQTLSLLIPSESGKKEV